MPSRAETVRLRLDLAYDGTDFSGWAVQPGRRTVGAELAGALTRVLRSRQPVRLTVAGRTDAGVHARGQVASADVDAAAWAALVEASGRRPSSRTPAGATSSRTPAGATSSRTPAGATSSQTPAGVTSSRTPADATLRRLLGVLPPDIVVRAATLAPKGFDARFSALWRRYIYRVCDRPAQLDPLRRRDTVVVRHPLDDAAMEEASRALLGLHDFAAFCRGREGATTVRTLLRFSWERQPDRILVATVVADAFCHAMVRSLVGAVLAVGEGRRAVDWPEAVLAAGERGVHVMPAHGLCLEEVGYPPDPQLAQRAIQARSRRDAGVGEPRPRVRAEGECG